MKHGAGNRYTVQPGDTLWSISNKARVPLSALINANPHITDPGQIRPGDVIIIPSSNPTPNPQFPCCMILRPTGQLPADAIGTSLVRRLAVLRPGRTAISILAHGLPDPRELGNFNAYQGIAFIPGVITWQWVLEPTSETFVTWAGTFTEITAELTPDTVIQVRPINTGGTDRGEAVLSGALADCS